MDAFWVIRTAPRLPTVGPVSIINFRRHHDDQPVRPVEREEVRQYRYLLRTADPETLTALHRRALGVLDPLVRANVLRTAQDRLLSGRDLTVDDIPQLAHLVCVGEIRTPGILVSAMSEMALERLAGAVLRLSETPGLLDGYDTWDGVDPDPRESASRLDRQEARQGA
jgi:hypothetical protein